MLYDLIAKKVAYRRIGIALPYLRGRVLDIGCGKGRLSEMLYGPYSYMGVDLNNGAQRDDIHVIDIEDPEKREHLPREFDSIVMLAVLEHLRNPADVVSWCSHRLANSGQLVMTTPTWFGNLLLDRIFRLKHLGHLHIFNKGSLYDVVQSAGLHVSMYTTFEVGANQVIVGKKEE